MAGVITDDCIKCKKMDCVEVCPVDAFYEGENMLVINPAECVDCGCCIEECPIDAIVWDNDLRASPWLELNAKYSKIWPNVTYKSAQTPSDSSEFVGVSEKYELHFSPVPGQGDVGPRPWPPQRKQCANCHSESLIIRLWHRIADWFR